MDRPRRLTLVLLFGAMVGACGGAIAAPPTGSPPAGTRVYVEVPYPPPPAHVEVVPRRPRDECVWVDGQWTWQGKRWLWESGGWVVPPAGAYYAPWLTNREPDGRLLFTSGSWHAADGRPLPNPPIIAPALSTPGESPSARPAAPPVDEVAR